MFTGLVEDVGQLVSVTPEGSGKKLVIRTKLSNLAIGDSVAADGICLTISGFPSKDCYQVVAGKETINLTTARSWKPGKKLNLERALEVGGRLGGHIVQGHVDGVGRIISIKRLNESVQIWISHPDELSKYIAKKGSVALNGVSLTVNELQNNSHRVDLIPHTFMVTSLSELQPGFEVNIEIDVMARYVERLLSKEQNNGLSIAHLRENGFIR